MTAKEILKLIEEVSPDDVAKLDGIDARVWAYLNPSDLYKSYKTFEEYFSGWTITRIGGSRGLAKRHKEYTRSRDELKSIRPNGWHIALHSVTDGNDCEIINYGGNRPTFKKSINLPTEELAELHAIIQAIEYERNNA